MFPTKSSFVNSHNPPYRHASYVERVGWLTAGSPLSVRYPSGGDEGGEAVVETGGDEVVVETGGGAVVVETG